MASIEDAIRELRDQETRVRTVAIKYEIVARNSECDNRCDHLGGCGASMRCTLFDHRLCTLYADRPSRCPECLSCEEKENG
jgi:hypothetical protein